MSLNIITYCIAYFKSWSAILDFRDVKLNIKRLQHALSLTKYDTCKALVIQSQILVIQRNIEKALEILNSAFKIADNDGERGEVAYFRYLHLPQIILKEYLV
jgi:hypothetical protein